ncbi:DEAD-box ATP-dependent RNA helicase 16-like [Pyrus x bretschneideri]|uniref:DEAD-box ATP-dependent RNA helicase 16-like n=1 Tax=Pyrus x bretschneideri TaxID=225117 RepID=UPI00202DC288|nr:DEAD-box ATP-dependent RNA helicase 16-like [Pyrus x bretschneideri]
MGEPTEKPPQEIESEDEEDQTFETLGLDGRLMRALNKKKIHKPTPIQLVAIPLTFKVRHLLQKLFASESKKKLAPSAIVLVPTRELSQQVYSEVSSSIEFCRAPLKVVQLTSSMPALDWRTALAALPEILVITPACIKKCLSDGVLQPASIDDSLEILVLDEMDQQAINRIPGSICSAIVKAPCWLGAVAGYGRG